MTLVRPALIARLYRAIEENRMSDAVLLLSQVFSSLGHSKRERDSAFLSELRKLGDEYVVSGDRFTAEEHFKLALALYEAFFTDQHEEALSSMRRLCDLLSLQKREEELERMLDWAYIIVQRIDAGVEGKAINAHEAINWQTFFEHPRSYVMDAAGGRYSTKSTPIQILLVEDNPDDAELVSEHLSKADAPIAIDYASELGEGIARVTRGGVDIILLDLGLPDSFALDTFYRMTSSAPQIPIIILTGVDDRNLALKAIKKGAHDYLVKGRDEPGVILRSIVDALNRRRDRDIERMTRSAASRAVEESIEKAPIGLMFIDIKGVVRNANDAWSAITGFKHQACVGKPFLELFPWVSNQKVENLLAGSSIRINDVRLNDRTFDIVAWPVRSPDNGIIGALVNTSCSEDTCLSHQG